MLKKNMKIIMILYKYFISDTRVKREAKTLAKKGFDIEIINLKESCNKSKGTKNHLTKIKNREIMEVDPKKRQSVIELLKFWIITFIHLIKLKNVPNIIHAHDLTGLPPAVLYKIVHPQVRVIYDSHELFPEAAKDKLNIFYWLSFLFIEILCSKLVNILIGASPLQLKILRKRINKPEFCLLNVPDLDHINKEFKLENLKDHPFSHDKESKIKVVYSGEVLPYRGYDEFIQSASKVIEKDPNFEFWIVGDGIYLNKVKEMVKHYNLSKYFIFTGAVPHYELLELTYNCDIAVGLYQNTINNNVMISNKIFEYMLVGTPFIFTSLTSSRKYIDAVKAIKIDFPIDPEKISEKILYLYKNKKLQNEISIRSRALIQEKLNWKKESAKLAAAYNELLNKKVSLKKYH